MTKSNAKLFRMIVGAATALFIAAAFLNRQGSRPVRTEAPQTLVAGLEARAGDITRIEITTPDGSLELVRTESRWTLPSKDGYPVDLEAVRTLVAGLASLEIIDQKTANPDNHGRLGLAVPTDPGSDTEPAMAQAPTRVRLLAADGSAVADVIVGNRAPTGVFVRTADDDQTWLADSAPETSIDPADWFDQRPVQVERDQVRTVTLTHPDGEVVRIVKNEDTFELAELPEGTEPVGPWQAGQPGGALAFLTVEDVRATDAIGFDDTEQVVVQYELVGEDADAAEQPTLTVRVAEIEGTPWATFAAAGPGADDVNAITEGWAYAIPAFTRDSLTRRIADLTQPIEPEPIDDAAGGLAGPEVPAALTPPSDD
ncbi:MAG: DUF4340 domain-containing protein [Planctomycetota bacterium]